MPSGVLERICSALGVQPGEIMEYVEDENNLP
jgi:DNA-binding Xre family transcriptional regulator